MWNNITNTNRSRFKGGFANYGPRLVLFDINSNLLLQNEI